MTEPSAIKSLNPSEFLRRAVDSPVIDVRSPAEYLKGHIPGSYNIPLFDDLERAEVGILYHNAGREKAIQKGLEIAGPKMTGYVDQAKRIANKEEALVHCWRGGMRSESMAWLMNTAGLTTRILQGGYKAYRKYIRESFCDGPSIIIIGGMTGSGKTDVLNSLKQLGEQVLDLEHLARHKGSVFGILGQDDQPTNEQFENDIADAWFHLNPDRLVWIEDESFNIGKVNIPKTLFQKMFTANCIVMEIPIQERVRRIIDEYAGFGLEILKNLLDKINRRLGGGNTQIAQIALDDGDFKLAVEIILKYYDKAYGFSVMKRDPMKVHHIKECTGIPESDARCILKYKDMHII